MSHIFEIIDKTNRKIHLSKERWSHIRKKHPEVEDPELIKENIINPDKIASFNDDRTINYYYKFHKYKKLPNKYLVVAIKYLNEHGYIITAYFDKHIR